jgi:hypothetical protein
MYTKIKFSFIFLLSSYAFAQEGIAVYSDYLSDNYLIHLLWLVLQIVKNKTRKQWFGQADARNFKQSVLMEESAKSWCRNYLIQ